MKKKKEYIIYKNNDINTARMMFIDEEKNPLTISRHFRGHPTRQTVSYWANRKDEHGKTWYDYRKAKADANYLQMSPQNVATALMDKMQQLLNDPGMEVSKFADAAYKLIAILEKVSDPQFQVPVLYFFLEDFVKFAQRRSTSVVTSEFLDMAEAYKNHVRGRLNGELTF